MNILIGSNGGLTGIYLAKQYRELSDLFLIGADSSEICTGKFFVDKQVFLPIATDNLFIEALIDTLNNNKIDVYIPTHSKEIKVVSMNSEKIKNNTNARFLVSPIETFMELESKLTANKKLSEVGIPVPRLIENYETQYPIIMKKSIGSGSHGTTIIENEIIHRAYKCTFDDVGFYQMIQGKEFTLDCMFDAKSQLVGFNQRQRIKTIGGAVSITKNDNEFDVAPWIDIISNRWKFCGCVNFQYIVEEGTPYFIDVNLRFPSGGLPLTVSSGLNVPQLIIDILKDKEVQKFSLPKENNNMTMYRYFEEIFE